MSVRVMAMVWDTDLPPHLKLVLLAYADHANDDGHSIYPGEEWMAAKTSYSPGTIRRNTRILIDEGYLERTKKGYRTQRAEYRINVTALEGAHIDTLSKGAHIDTERRASDGERRASDVLKARVGDTPNHHEPSEPSENHQLAQHASQLSKGEYHTAMKDALVEAMGWHVDEIPKAQWGRIEAAAKMLTGLNADPDEVGFRAQVYRVNMAGATMTPNAIATNWPDLATPREPLPARQVRRAAARASSKAAITKLGEGE